MSDTRQAALASGGSDPIFQKQMAAIHADLDTIAEKRHDTVMRR